MKTYLAKPHEVVRQWHLLDADGQILGRLAVRAAVLLRGKHKATWTPHIDTGDGVVVVNAAKIRVTGLKLQQKQYFRFSGYPGGQKVEMLGHLMARKPTEAVYQAIRGMIPHNPLGRQMLRRLKVYPGAEHPHRGLTITRGQSPAGLPAGQAGTVPSAMVAHA